jgi:hypothetical protein
MSYYERYIDNLTNQYIEATGEIFVDFGSRQFVEIFNYWLRERKEKGETYLKFLEYMGLYGFDDEQCAETDKGYYDTVVENCRTTIITPFSEVMENRMPGRKIVKGYMSVIDELPIFYDGVRRDFISNNYINRYMTQNPYSPELIRGWGRLHDSGNVDIIVGVYGKNSDKDKEQKLLMLQKLRREVLFRDDKYDLAYVDGWYYAAVGSDRKTLDLVKTPTRGRGI